MVFQVKDDLRLELPVMSNDSPLFNADSPKSDSTKSFRMSALKTKSSKRSSGYSKDQVKQLLELFPEISHLQKRADNETLEELFPDCLAELVQILGSPKKVEKELFRRKEAREKESRRTAEREARKTAGVRFASTTNDSRVFECLESEALRRAGIADKALANATAARDKVHKLYKGLISTTNPVKCDRKNDDDSSAVSSMRRMSTAPTESNAAGEEENGKNNHHTTTNTVKKNRSSESKPNNEQHPIQPYQSNNNNTKNGITKERWESLRSEARVVITRRLLIGWRMSSETCQGSECNKCPLLMKQRRMQCVVCGGSGSGQDGMYASGNQSTTTSSTRLPVLPAASSGQSGTVSSKRPSPSQILKPPSMLGGVMTPESSDSNDSPSNVLGKLTRKIEKHQQTVAEAATGKSQKKSIKSSPKKLDKLLEQQKKVKSYKQGSVIVYDVTDDSSYNLEQVEVQKRNSYNSEISVSNNSGKIRGFLASANGDNGSTSVGTRSKGSSSSSNESSEDSGSTSQAPDDDVNNYVPRRVQLDDKEKQEILEEVQSILTKSATSSKHSMSAKRSRVGQGILAKTEEGWSLLDASCHVCDMPLLVDPTGETELCVYCEVKRKERRGKRMSSTAQEPEIHLDPNRCTPSEITDSLCGKPRKPPVSVTVIHSSGGTGSSSDPSGGGGNQGKSAASQILPPMPNDGRSSVGSPIKERPRRSRTKRLDEIDSQLRPVASPGFDSQVMFPIPVPRDLQDSDYQGSEGNMEFRQDNEGDYDALRQVASPDFDDHNMFPFLKDGRQGINGERLPHGNENTQHPGYTGRDHYEGQSLYGERPVAEGREFMGILPQHVEEANHVGTIQPPDNTFVLPPWSSSGVPSPRQQSKRQHLAEKLRAEWRQEQLVYEQVKERIRGDHSESSVSAYEPPLAKDTLDFRDRPHFQEGYEEQFPPYDLEQTQVPWQNPHVNVYAAHTHMSAGETRQSSSNRFFGATDEFRDEPPVHSAPVPDYAHGVNPYESNELAYMATEGASRYGSETAKDVNDEMRLRVAENIKVERFNGTRMQPTRETTLNSANLHIFEEVPTEYVSPRAHPHQGAPFNFQTAAQPQALASPQTSTNFYEQLQSRAEYAAWKSHHPYNDQMQGSQQARPVLNSTNSLSRNQHSSYSGGVIHGSADGRATDVKKKMPQSENMQSLQHSNQQQNGSHEESLPAQMSMLSEGPLPSVREIPNEVSSPNNASPAEKNSSGKVLRSPTNGKPTSKENSSLVSSLGVQGMDTSSRGGDATKRASSKESLSLVSVSSLGVQGMEEGHVSGEVGVSSPAIVKSRTKSLVDELSLSTKDPAKSASSKQSDSGGSESLLTSIRFHGQATKNAGQDPPDAPLHVAFRGYRVGRDPEEVMGLSPRRVKGPRTPRESPLKGSPEQKSMESPLKGSPQQKSNETPVLKPDLTNGGYSIVIPDGFDFSDEEQMRKLFLSARNQSAQQEMAEAKQAASSSTESQGLTSPTPILPEDESASNWLSPNKLRWPETGSFGLIQSISKNRSSSEGQSGGNSSRGLKTSSSNSSAQNKSDGLPMLPSLNSGKNASDISDKYVYHTVGAPKPNRYHQFEQNPMLKQLMDEEEDEGELQDLATPSATMRSGSTEDIEAMEAGLKHSKPKRQAGKATETGQQLDVHASNIYNGPVESKYYAQASTAGMSEWMGFSVSSGQPETAGSTTAAMTTAGGSDAALATDPAHGFEVTPSLGCFKFELPPSQSALANARREATDTVNMGFSQAESTSMDIATKMSEASKDYEATRAVMDLASNPAVATHYKAGVDKGNASKSGDAAKSTGISDHFEVLKDWDITNFEDGSTNPGAGKENEAGNSQPEGFTKNKTSPDLQNLDVSELPYFKAMYEFMQAQFAGQMSPQNAKSTAQVESQRSAAPSDRSTTVPPTEKAAPESEPEKQKEMQPPEIGAAVKDKPVQKQLLEPEMSPKAPVTSPGSPPTPKPESDVSDKLAQKQLLEPEMSPKPPVTSPGSRAGEDREKVKVNSPGSTSSSVESETKNKSGQRQPLEPDMSPKAPVKSPGSSGEYQETRSTSSTPPTASAVLESETNEQTSAVRRRIPVEPDVMTPTLQNSEETEQDDSVRREPEISFPELEVSPAKANGMSSPKAKEMYSPKQRELASPKPKKLASPRALISSPKLDSQKEYLESLIESIRAPARVWDEDVPRPARSDPPECEKKPDRKTTRVALDPDEVDVTSFAATFQAHDHHLFLPSPTSRAGREVSRENVDLPFNYSINNVKTQMHTGQKTRPAKEPSGVNGDVACKLRDMEDSSGVLMVSVSNTQSGLQQASEVPVVKPKLTQESPAAPSPPSLPAVRSPTTFIGSNEYKSEHHQNYQTHLSPMNQSCFEPPSLSKAVRSPRESLRGKQGHQAIVSNFNNLQPPSPNMERQQNAGLNSPGRQYRTLNTSSRDNFNNLQPPSPNMERQQNAGLTSPERQYRIKQITVLNSPKQDRVVDDLPNEEFLPELETGRRPDFSSQVRLPELSPGGRLSSFKKRSQARASTANSTEMATKGRHKSKETQSGTDSDDAIFDIRIPSSSRKEKISKEKTCPKPEISARANNSTKNLEAQQTQASDIHMRKHRNTGRLNEYPSDEHTGITPALEPRVQSPYFDGISPLGADSDPAIPSPQARKQRESRPWAQENMLKVTSPRSKRAPPMADQLPPPPPRQSRKLSASGASPGPCSPENSTPKKPPRAREPSYGEDAASQKDTLAASTKTGTTRTRGSTHLEIQKAYRIRGNSSSSISSWTTDESFGPKANNSRTRSKASVVRRVLDNLRFEAQATESSSVSSISSRRHEKLHVSDRRNPVRKEEVPLRRRKETIPNMPHMASSSVSSSSSRRHEKLHVSDRRNPVRKEELPPRRKKETIPNVPNKASSKSYGSYSSWATRDNTSPRHKSPRHAKTEARKHGKLSNLQTVDDDDKGLYFIGGPLDQKGSTDFLASPASAGSDSTPFEDILNRCKSKLERLSVPSEDNREDERVPRSSPSRKFRSYGSRSTTSESQIIDLVDHDDAMSMRSVRTSRTARSERTSRSANY